MVECIEYDLSVYKDSDQYIWKAREIINLVMKKIHELTIIGSKVHEIRTNMNSFITFEASHTFSYGKENDQYLYGFIMGYKYIFDRNMPIGNDNEYVFIISTDKGEFHFYINKDITKEREDAINNLLKN